MSELATRSAQSMRSAALVARRARSTTTATRSQMAVMRSEISAAGAASASTARAPTGSSMPSRPMTTGHAEVTRPSAPASPVAWIRSWAASWTGLPARPAAASRPSIASSA